MGSNLIELWNAARYNEPFEWNHHTDSQPRFQAGLLLLVTGWISTSVVYVLSPPTELAEIAVIFPVAIYAVPLLWSAVGIVLISIAALSGTGSEEDSNGE